MIVFDASSIVGAALGVDSVPERALNKAATADIFALSVAVDEEIASVLARPKFTTRISASRRESVLLIIREGAAWFQPTIIVRACRDPTDEMYLALAYTAGAALIVSSDADLLTMDPWRGIRILNPKDYFTRAT